MKMLVVSSLVVCFVATAVTSAFVPSPDNMLHFYPESHQDGKRCFFLSEVYHPSRMKTTVCMACVIVCMRAYVHVRICLCECVGV